MITNANCVVFLALIMIERTANWMSLLTGSESCFNCQKILVLVVIIVKENLLAHLFVSYSNEISIK